MIFFSAKISPQSSPRVESSQETSSPEDTSPREDPPAPPDVPPETVPKEDGVLLYLAIKVKDQFRDEDEVDDKMRKLFKNDFNNNPGTIQKVENVVCVEMTE